MSSPSTVDQRPAAPARLRARAAAPRLLPALGIGALVAVVFLVHFRPWQGGLLEEWGLALAWDEEGLGGLAARTDDVLGRPLHLVPHFLGMALSGGGFVGMYGVLGAVAVAQLLTSVRAVRPVLPHPALRWALGTALALHPWWAGGDVLRFLSAQVAVLGVVLWLGAAVRVLLGRSLWWTVLLVAGPAAGLLTYQAPAAALLLGAVLVPACVVATNRRRLLTAVLTAAVTGAVLVWSAVIAPRLSPDSYEGALIGGSLDLAASVRSIGRTLVLHAPAATAALAGLGLLVVGLGFAQRLSARQAWLLLAATAVAPLSALSYAMQALHLHDPERVAHPTGLAAWLVLVCTLVAARLSTTWVRAVAAALVVVSLAGAVVGYSTWTRFASAQQSLLDVVEPLRAEARAGTRLVVVDRSGAYGDVYTFLPPHLDVALAEEAGPGPSVTLCTPDDTPREQPLAARFPIATTPGCADVLTPDAEALLAATTTLGPVEVYSVASD